MQISRARQVPFYNALSEVADTLAVQALEQHQPPHSQPQPLPTQQRPPATAAAKPAAPSPPPQPEAAPPKPDPAEPDEAAAEPQQEPATASKEVQEPAGGQQEADEGSASQVRGSDPAHVLRSTGTMTFLTLRNRVSSSGTFTVSCSVIESDCDAHMIVRGPSACCCAIAYWRPQKM